MTSETRARLPTELGRATIGESALSASYARRARQLWSFARRLGADPQTAEDVMQEAFARAANQPASAIVDLDAWLFRLVHNLVVDHARASSRRATPAELPSPRDALGSDDRVTLWAAVDRLPPRQRAAVYLRFRSDLDFRTIASVLGITEGGARANCARALETLRTLVDER